MKPSASVLVIISGSLCDLHHESHWKDCAAHDFHKAGVRSSQAWRTAGDHKIEKTTEGEHHTREHL